MLMLIYGGPSQTQTLGEGRYFLSIIDDFSRRVWVYILKNKADVFGKFKEWHTEYENKLGTKLKHLRTDNGLEFVSYQFNDFADNRASQYIRQCPIPLSKMG